MIVIDKQIDLLHLTATLKDGVYVMVTGDSGKGKSYYMQILTKMLQSDGYKALYFDWESHNAIPRFIESMDYDVIILGTLEYYGEELDIQKVIESTKVLILIDRTYRFDEDYYMTLRMNINGHEVNFS